MALKRVLLLAVAAAFIAGCGGSSSSERASKAIREAGAVFRAGPYDLFPTTSGSRSCRIPAGGVTSHYVSGTCATRVRVGKGGSAVVSFVETWGNGAASHTWHFTVSPDDHVTDSGEHGDVPPQNAV